MSVHARAKPSVSEGFPVPAQERGWLRGFALALVLLTSLPYLIAVFNQGNQWVFTGFFYGVEDGNSYIAKMLAGAQGDWLFRSPYSAQPQAGALLYFPYILLGKLLGPNAQHDQLAFLFHAFRVGSIFAVCFATYGFLSFFLQEKKFRRLGLLLATLGGGLGWVLLLFGSVNWLGSLPLDFYSPEAFGFLAIFGLPHLAFARALLLSGLLAYLRPPKPPRRRLTALLWLALALTHAITAALGLLLIAAHLILLFLRRNKRQTITHNLQAALWALLGTGPILLINLVQFLRDPYLQAWAAQNQILSPYPLHYILAYALLLPFALIGIRGLLSRNKISGTFLLTWLLLLPVLLYAPFGLQRRFAEGAWLLLIVLALSAFDSGFWAQRPRAVWLFALALPSTLILYVGSLQIAGHPASPTFRPAVEVAAFNQLRAQSTSGKLVLAVYSTGNALPAWVPVRVLIGHGPESVGLEVLQPEIAAFYTEMTSETRLEFIEKYGIDYVFWGPNERNLGDWHPSQAAYLDLLFELDGYSVYQDQP